MVYGWIWIAVLVMAVIIEVITDQLISIWFVPASIIATIMDFCDANIIWQIIVFLVVSAVGIVLAKTFLSKLISKEDTRTNIEAIIGEKCIVIEKVDNFAGCGQVKVKGQVWSARSVCEDDVFDVGDVLSVVAIEGVKVICKK